MAAFKLVRRNRKTNKVQGRPRGRWHPGYEYGYLDAAGAFQAGNPPKRRGRGPGRPKGQANSNGAGLGQIEAIVKSEVTARLQAARRAALAAFDRALGL